MGEADKLQDALNEQRAVAGRLLDRLLQDGLVASDEFNGAVSDRRQLHVREVLLDELQGVFDALEAKRGAMVTELRSHRDALLAQLVEVRHERDDARSRLRNCEQELAAAEEQVVSRGVYIDKIAALLDKVAGALAGRVAIRTQADLPDAAARVCGLLKESEARVTAQRDWIEKAMAVLDRVFQGPDAILAGHLNAGDSKIEAVETLARAYLAQCKMTAQLQKANTLAAAVANKAKATAWAEQAWAEQHITQTGTSPIPRQPVDNFAPKAADPAPAKADDADTGPAVGAMLDLLGRVYGPYRAKYFTALGQALLDYDAKTTDKPPTAPAADYDGH